MGYFKNKIRQLVDWATSDDRYSAEINYSNAKVRAQDRHSIEDNGRGMNFTVFSATGGKVIQVRSYDPRTDVTRSTLYVVTDKEDLGHELAQIITVESLSR